MPDLADTLARIEHANNVYRANTPAGDAYGLGLADGAENVINVLRRYHGIEPPSDVGHIPA